jgi:hypothetical protein
MKVLLLVLTAYGPHNDDDDADRHGIAIPGPAGGLDDAACTAQCNSDGAPLGWGLLDSASAHFTDSLSRCERGSLRLAIPIWFPRCVAHELGADASAVLQTTLATLLTRSPDRAKPTSSGDTVRTAGSTELHSVTRWASAVLGAIPSHADPRTLAHWGRSTGASPAAIRTWCRAARVSSRRSLLFARVLRAVVRHRGSESPASDLLDVVDHRTLRKLLVGSGASGTTLPPTAEEFLSSQTFITDRRLLDEVRSRLNARLTAAQDDTHGK